MKKSERLDKWRKKKRKYLRDNEWLNSLMDNYDRRIKLRQEAHMKDPLKRFLCWFFMCGCEGGKYGCE